MKISITYKKMNILICMLILLIAQIIILVPLLFSDNTQVDYGLIIASNIAVVSFIIEVILWRNLSGNFFSPYIVFLGVMFIFCCGQSIGWAFGIDMGGKDMWYRSDGGITHDTLLQALVYSILGMSTFQIGALLSFKKSKGIGQYTEQQVKAVFKWIGNIGILVIFPAFLLKSGQDIMSVVSGGYAGYYEVNQSRSVFMDVVSILANYYLPCLLLLFIAYSNNFIKRNLVIIGMLLEAAMGLFIGGRSGAVMTILAILLSYHYFVKPFKKKDVIYGLIFGYLILGLLNAIAIIRNIQGITFSEFVDIMGQAYFNTIGAFIGEMGWSITSLALTMIAVPSYENFRYGLSYIVSLITWVPSYFFGGRELHPVVVWGNLADWLQNTFNFTSGPGYTIFAESYINFGWFGLLFLIIEGYIIAKYIARVSYKEVNNNLLGATMQIMIILTIMKAIVRSSTTVAMRNVFFVIIPLFYILNFILKKYIKSSTHK